MAYVWDNTLVSKLRPDSPAYRYCQHEAARGRPVILAAGALNETGCGYQKQAERRADFRNLVEWFERDVLSQAWCRILSVDGHAAWLAGKLRALAPIPRAPKGTRKTKSERRTAWHYDLQIAAACWSAGHDVATENTSDFVAIADLLEQIAPGAPRLEVAGSPF
jgi:predicted nucleic acid-binding protein